MKADRFNEHELAAVSRYGFSKLTAAETKVLLSLIYSIPHPKRKDQDALQARVQLIRDTASTLHRFEIDTAAGPLCQVAHQIDEAIRALEGLRQRALLKADT